MAIPREYATSNPLVRDALAKIPLPIGKRAGDFVAPDFSVDSEIVDSVVIVDHVLNTDDLRAADAEAKAIRFETGSTVTLSVNEHALKTTIDSRKIEEAQSRGSDVVAERLAMLRNDILDNKELAIATKFETAANYAAGHKVNALNFRTVDLFATIDVQRDTIVADGGVQPQFAVIGMTAWRGARQNVAFNTFVSGVKDKQAGSNMLTLAAFAEYLGLSEVRLGDFRRKVGNGTTATQFWPVDQFLLFAQQATMSNRTLGQTMVVPYGGAPGQGQGALVDARTAPPQGTELITEIGCYHRYLVAGLNFNLGFLSTAISIA
jgi:hypothetical protein